jgi:hypothetical protein
MQRGKTTVNSRLSRGAKHEIDSRKEENKQLELDARLATSRFSLLATATHFEYVGLIFLEERVMLLMAAVLAAHRDLEFE